MKHRYKVTLNYQGGEHISYHVARSKLQARTYAIQRLASLLKVEPRAIRNYFLYYTTNNVTIRRLRDE